MTKLNLGTYSLFPAIIFWGVLLGAVVYSHLVFFSVYLSDLPSSAVVVNGKYGLNDAAFWMMIHPLIILSLVISLALNWKFKARRNLILPSFVIYLILLIISFLYFVPELMVFKASPESNIPAAEWLARSNRWQYLSWIRGTICFVAFVALLIALTKSPELPEDTA